ncbi:hypothetical protein [Desulfobacula sp.]|uniref:hypothetical protein n=1 Tax=Desulfobacula sp. TaxID=2593537 RepID=UPI0025BBA2D4|nr:hypothetical protein [Desulfobacula sp.]MBC2704782.1 hypothetical protein [Desulfobacula sp.]
MKFSDLFLPKYLHSDPAVRQKFAGRSEDVNLLEQMAQKDKDADVRKFAAERAQMLKSQEQTA